jgi:hypothetical protein
MKRILILTALALIAFGCSRTDEVKNTTVANAPAANTEANAPAVSEPVIEENFTGGANPKSDVFYSTKKQMATPVWSVTVTSETALELNMLMEHVAPNRYYVKQPGGEVIVIGKDSYVNQNNKWQKVEVDLSQMISSQAKLVTEEALQNIKDVQKVGTEQINGIDTIIYTYKSEGENPGESTTTKVWIDKNNGLPMKINVEGMINGKMQKVSSVYDYEKKVKIEAPKID